MDSLCIAIYIRAEIIGGSRMAKGCGAIYGKTYEVTQCLSLQYDIVLMNTL